LAKVIEPIPREIGYRKIQIDDPQGDGKIDL
jgi:hypothetical protein